jgi:hypothetical protein
VGWGGCSCARVAVLGREWRVSVRRRDRWEAVARPPRGAPATATRMGAAGRARAARDQDIRVTHLPLPLVDEIGDNAADLDGGGLGDVVVRAETDRV